jgi:sterol desaturase/sphingolipid hydroxylase (fatty acid hydroxylase superfamily)
MYVRTVLGQGLVVVTTLGLVYLLVWKLGARVLAARQRSRPVSGRQLRHELRHTVVTVLLGAGYATVVAVLYRAGLTRLSTDASEWSPLSFVATVAGLILLNDLWFYGCHRLLHRPWLFRHVHAVHHRSVHVNPFTSYSFHGVEALLLSAWLLPLVMTVPLYLPVFGVVQVLGTANNVMSHLGYELLPRGLLRVPGLRWINTATFHHLHHTRYHGNYGLFSRVWDRLFGTELPGYEEAFLERRSNPPSAPPEA